MPQPTQPMDAGTVVEQTVVAAYPYVVGIVLLVALGAMAVAALVTVWRQVRSVRDRTRAQNTESAREAERAARATPEPLAAASESRRRMSMDWADPDDEGPEEPTDRLEKLLREVAQSNRQMHEQLQKIYTVLGWIALFIIMPVVLEHCPRLTTR